MTLLVDTSVWSLALRRDVASHAPKHLSQGWRATRHYRCFDRTVMHSASFGFTDHRLTRQLAVKLLSGVNRLSGY